MSDSVSTRLEAIVESMGGQSRVGQREMAEAVMAAFSAGDNIVVQAGTGTGKSLAYLVPAARMARAAASARAIASTSQGALDVQMQY